MTRNPPTTKSQRRLSPEERGRSFAKLAAEISQGILPGDYSDATISAFGVEMGKRFAEWEAEDARRKRAERKPRKPMLLASVAKQARKAAIGVDRYEIKPDGTVVIVTGEPEAAALENPWLADLRKRKIKQ
jgi:hypothetical protein